MVRMILQTPAPKGLYILRFRHLLLKSLVMDKLYFEQQHRGQGSFLHFFCFMTKSEGRGDVDSGSHRWSLRPLKQYGRSGCQGSALSNLCDV